MNINCERNISCEGRFAVSVSWSSSIESRIRPISMPERTNSCPVRARRDVMSGELTAPYIAQLVRPPQVQITAVTRSAQRLRDDFRNVLRQALNPADALELAARGGLPARVDLAPAVVGARPARRGPGIERVDRAHLV